jgi:hypothetical protein
MRFSLVYFNLLPLLSAATVHLFPTIALEPPFALGIFLTLVTLLLLRSQQELMLLELLPVLLLLQYWVAPSLAYYWQSVAPAQVINPMPIGMAQYTATIIPLVLALWCGVQLGSGWRPQKNTATPATLEKALAAQPLLPVLLLGGGILATLLAPITPAVLRLPIYFAQQGLLIGSLHLLFCSPKKWGHYLVLLAVIAWQFWQAVASTMLGPMVWLILILLVYAQWQNRWPLWHITTAGVLGALLLVGILTWKYDYREQALTAHTWGDKVVKLKIVLQERLAQPIEARHWNRALCRLNQGYLTALAVRQVPRHQPFVGGETIRVALLGALLPRALWRNKPEAGGKVNFERFTGEKLSPGVSMNIGPLGDAYVNYGVRGGMVFMFVYGLAISLGYGFFLQFTTAYPLLLLWAPLIFVPLLEVETDVLTVFNHAVKSSVFVAVAFPFFRYTTSKINS